MKQNIEIEFKNLLTKEQYNQLLSLFPFDKPFKQVNYYFETRDFQLKKFNSALRIREKEGKYTLTLKQPYEEHLLETHLTLTKAEAKACLKGEFLVNEEFSQSLVNLGVKVDDLIYFGKLITYRSVYKKQENLYVLDHSLYNGKEDFEFELEVKDAKEGKKLFLNILQKANIEITRTPNKIERFFRSLKSE